MVPVRPEVLHPLIDALDAVFAALPETYRESAWVGQRWRIGQATIAHVFGGEDHLLRIIFRAPESELMAFEHLGPRYFRAGWGHNVVGVVLGEPDAWGEVDWEELQEMLIDSYCEQAPAKHVLLAQRMIEQAAARAEF